MRMHIDFIDNDVVIDDEKISALEIENKKYFYRIVDELYKLSNREEVDVIGFYDENDNEINNLKIQMIVDFFDLGFSSRKLIMEVQKSVTSLIDEESRIELNKAYNNLYMKMVKAIRDIDLPLKLDQDFNLNDIVKILNLSIEKQDNLLDNLFLIIDINKNLKIYDLLYFINLKQYLSNDEIKELYKYAIYNNVKIILIDSQTYGITLKNEKKLIIDDNLDEFMI